MEKMTVQQAINVMEKYTDITLSKVVIEAHNMAIEALEKQAEYKALEEQGLLFRLSCAIGSTVWFVGNEIVNDYEIRRYIVDESGIDCIQIAKKIDGRDYWNSFDIDDFGKTVFFTKEQAEAALEKMKGGKA